MVIAQLHEVEERLVRELRYGQFFTTGFETFRVVFRGQNCYIKVFGGDTAAAPVLTSRSSRTGGGTQRPRTRRGAPLLGLRRQYQTSKKPVSHVTIIPFRWKNIQQIKDNMAFRNELLVYRSTLIDYVLNSLISGAEDCSRALCSSRPSGSVGANQNINSDYDVTLSGTRNVSALAASLASVFRKVYNCTPSEMFNANVFVHSFMVPIQSQRDLQGSMLQQWRVLCVPKDNVVAPEKQQQQYACLLPNAEHPAFRALCLQQDQFLLLRARDSSAAGPGPRIVAASGKTERALCIAAGSGIEFPLKLSSAEREQLYMHKIREFESGIENPDTPLLQQSAALTASNVYADDGYYTAGAFIHVVGTMYYGDASDAWRRTVLSRPVLFQSALENLCLLQASFLQYIGAARDDPDMLNIEERALIKCSKYWMRVTDAVLRYTELYEEENNATNEKSNMLAKSLSYLSKIKRHFYGREIKKTNTRGAQINQARRLLTAANKLFLHAIDGSQSSENKAQKLKVYAVIDTCMHFVSSMAKDPGVHTALKISSALGDDPWVLHAR